MKLCGHTMGTPGKDALEAIEFFSGLGLEGIELRCAANGQLDTDRATDEDLAAIGRAALSAGIKVACLTPYLRNFATLAAAVETLAGYERACRAAALLDCPLVRATGGVWPLDGAEREAVWHRTVEGLRRACDIAAEHGVALALENHSGTLTQSATDTLAMVMEVDRPNLGILMDHYWVVLAGEEDPLEAVELQAPYVLHCHCKNLIYRDGKPQAHFLDEGQIDWLQVLTILHRYGYEGYLSDEYEKLWRPELPEPEEGMARNAGFLRRCLDRLRA
jgi:sugar phosphate isomerase/epimerase